MHKCDLSNFTYKSGLVILCHSGFPRVFLTKKYYRSGYSSIVLAPAESLKKIFYYKEGLLSKHIYLLRLFSGDLWWKDVSPGSRRAEPKEDQAYYLLRTVVHHLSLFLLLAYSFHTLAVWSIPLGLNCNLHHKERSCSFLFSCCV